MITDRITHEIQSMKALAAKEKQKKDRENQSKIDIRYSTAVADAAKWVKAVNEARKTLGFKLSDTTHGNLREVLTAFKAVPSEGMADQDKITRAANSFKDVQTDIKNEWAAFYRDYTAPIVTTLNSIGTIWPEQIQQLLLKIGKASAWKTDDPKMFADLKACMRDAGNLIQNSKLTPVVSAFLTKMASGEACIGDLSDEVLAWLREERLENRIRLSFRAESLK